MLADKHAEAVALALGRVCKRWLCANTPGQRGQAGEVLAQRVKTVLPGAGVVAFGSLSAALQEAVSSVSRDQTILVFGSFSTVSGAAAWVQNSMQHDNHDAAKITRRRPATDH